MKEQIEEIARVLCEKYDTEHCKVCDHHGRCMVRLEAEWIYEAGYRKQSEWISVEDQEEPTENGTYLCYGYWVYSGRKQIETVRYFGEWDIVNNFVLTHWMPLPSAPEMKGE